MPMDVFCCYLAFEVTAQMRVMKLSRRDHNPPTTLVQPAKILSLRNDSLRNYLPTKRLPTKLPPHETTQGMLYFCLRPQILRQDQALPSNEMSLAAEQERGRYEVRPYTRPTPVPARSHPPPALPGHRLRGDAPVRRYARALLPHPRGPVLQAPGQPHARGRRDGEHSHVPASSPPPGPHAHTRAHAHAQMEPLSVAIHAVANIAQLRANQSVVVFGAGPVGLLCMAVARALGASRVVAVDIVPSRLEFAAKYAATETYTPPKPQEGETRLAYSERNANTMKEQLKIAERGPEGIDVVVDASGAEVSIQTGIHIAKHGGTFIQVRALSSSSL